MIMLIAVYLIDGISLALLVDVRTGPIAILTFLGWIFAWPLMLWRESRR